VKRHLAKPNSQPNQLPKRLSKVAYSTGYGILHGASAGYSTGYGSLTVQTVLHGGASYCGGEWLGHSSTVTHLTKILSVSHDDRTLCFSHSNHPTVKKAVTQKPLPYLNPSVLSVSIHTAFTVRSHGAVCIKPPRHNLTATPIA
jgi:hypothetical protein